MKYILILMALAGCTSAPKQSMNSWARDRVVMLYSATGACTGVQVKAPSKKVYILTARHCDRIADAAGNIFATNEAGRIQTVRIIAKADGPADLMLMSSMDDVYVPIANTEYTHERIFTMTHGNAFPSFRTDGELLKQIRVDVEDLTLDEWFSTAWVIPGSSGGPAMNLRGELIGIVSLGGGPLSGLVPLSDIKAFLADK